MVSEVRVCTDAIAFVTGHRVIDLVSCVSTVTIGSIDIVWELRLVEDRHTIVTVPLNHVAKGMLCSKTVSNDIVTIDNGALGYRVITVVHKALFVVISTPQPSVINDNISAVDNYHGISSCWVCILIVSSSDSSEYIGHYTRIVTIAWMIFITPLDKRIRLCLTSL